MYNTPGISWCFPRSPRKTIQKVFFVHINKYYIYVILPPFTLDLYVSLFLYMGGWGNYPAETDFIG